MVVFAVLLTGGESQSVTGRKTDVPYIRSWGDSAQMGWSLLSPETTSAVRDKELYEWIPVIVLSNSVAKEFLTWFPAISEM